jgi:hypothetical protein
MPLSVLEVKKEFLNKQIATFAEQYNSLCNQILYESNKANKVLLEKQSEALLGDWDKAETELEMVNQSLSSKNQHRIHLQWKQHLPKIDFEQAMKRFSDIVSEFDLEGGAAVFLLPNSDDMCGDLCVERIREILVDNNGEPPRYHEIGFLYETPCKIKFLQKLGEYYKVDPVLLDPPSLIQAITAKICSGLSVKSVLLIRVTVTEELDVCEGFVKWFLADFWSYLKNRLVDLTKDRPYIRFIAVIDAWNPVPAEFIEKYQLLNDSCNGDRFLLLPLEQWELKQVRAWLFSLPGLKESMTPEQVVQFKNAAESICKGNRSPKEIRHRLINFLEKKYAEVQL